ncbi:amino acid adenylation protein [Mycobacterium avium subsp. hominissuis]|uniref:Amino acid adenylation protein n=1 Tax=Mycobacterium avium subsp. hominissuis TaxID=439334 RepID=A0A2A3L4S8_MYCAV|nr:amino acid adenylation domain-containing protein [Mycobacterium avium subsp. hominissuis]PBJ28145.1 amino acid adenylation protein [Mycobacterium avium subsp. hominissuis]PBJ31700.1 amino acid adenylation protein [Mycobacterium avium subsp. hominissuis]PBJ65914.1 amino acid adenylation protein [Mycobacterium avium subsp. hominissuis]QXD08197.1 amino acid adenylation domain-containing protein [Mycobacterium avium subsp. hominissuis]
MFTINRHQPRLLVDDALPGGEPRRPTWAGGAGHRRRRGQRCGTDRVAVTADTASRSNCALDPVSSALKPRTLVEILEKTASRYPEAPALDDGTVILTYRDLIADLHKKVAWLAAAGIGRGDRVGIRMPSGSNALYVAILATLAAGAAYVPVDVEDPDERADLVFSEAGVVAVITEQGLVGGPGSSRGRRPSAPRVGDDAWIIFTSGSTGTPKGVVVTHRSAAAFVDAEAQLFLRDNPMGPGDRVLAGLSVAFDASCEEMWLAWRHGACLVPAPRSLVRAGPELGPWLMARGVTVVSTVPTLAALWPAQALQAVRLLIVGGEPCPPELAERLAVEGREVWNTYGPTEATVVACAARLTGSGPVRIGLPLPGWDLAVIDRDGQPVGNGEVGELVIGGVGLGRYLDPELDAARYAPLRTLGWGRAYRSGDLVRLEPEGLVFVGRADDQVKVGGRRVELGEVDSALVNLPGVRAAASAVRRTAGGVVLLVGYLVSTDSSFDLAAARTALRQTLPAAVVPRLVLVDELPTRVSGKVDREALPWPVDEIAGQSPDLGGTMGWLAGLWRHVLGAAVDGPDADFFALGGESLSAAQLVVALRQRYPQVTIAQLYEHSRLSSLAGFLDELDPPVRVVPRPVRPTPRSTQAAQVLLSLPLATLTGMQWVTWLALVSNVAAALRPLPWLVTLDWWWIIAGFVLFITPPGRVGVSVLGARLLLSGVRPGSYRRGGSEHLRVWFAEGLVEASRVQNLVGTPWLICYARALGNKVGKGVDLHAMPPVTGMLRLGHRSAIEPEVDLCGHWVDGDLFHVGRIWIGNDAIVGARTSVLPGAWVGDNAQIAPGSSVAGTVGNSQYWAGSPAAMSGAARHRWPRHRPPSAPLWGAVFALMPMLLGALPLVAEFAGLAVLSFGVRDSRTLLGAIVPTVAWMPVAVAASLTVYATLTVLGVRVLSLGLREGHHPVHSRLGWQLWATGRLMATARNYLFPLYASLLTPLWLRLLGAKVGRGTEISTALVTPKFTVVADGAFLADDTMVASYELGGGWIQAATATIGNRAFLGNSAITSPGHRVPDGGLVAVLSLAPRKATTGSSWLGSPPVRLRRRTVKADAGRTYHPSLPLKMMRGAVETARLIPLLVSFAIGVAVVDALQWLASEFGYRWAALGSGVVLLAAGAIAGGAAVVAKWLLVGRIRVTERPLWSSFVWRNEVSEVFMQTVAAPWFARAATGTPMLNLWLRALGASIGRGVWCETYWLPEADLVTLGAGATANRGSVVQTHLFHDRIMRTGTVVLEPGATLGPHSVALPAARLGAGATVGPASLVMGGDHVPPSTRWQGNPITPWMSHKTRRRAADGQTKKIAA